MAQLLLVGTGGFVGSVARYLVYRAVARSLPEARFPLDTLIVNVVGCFAIGLLATRTLGSGDTAARHFLVIGVLGGFTTFSTFGFDTFTLAREQGIAAVLTNVSLQVALGLAAVWAGFFASRALGPGP